MSTCSKNIVMKFGGSSLMTITLIYNAAKKIQEKLTQGYLVTVIVSAMGKETDRLVKLVEDVNNPEYSNSPHKTYVDAREYDVIVSSAENVTAGLMAIVLQNLGINARSWLSWQTPIHTTDRHSNADIISVNVTELQRRMLNGEVNVLAGFQGLSSKNRLTTLGRGGSDTTAVCLAAALNAPCFIYTDVEGVFTADPSIVKNAAKIASLNYEEMLELASAGARVLHTKSVLAAIQHKVTLHVCSSFSDSPGTTITQEDRSMIQRPVTGISLSSDEAQITLLQLQNIPGVAARVLEPLEKHSINVDMIIQSAASIHNAEMTFSLAARDLSQALELMQQYQKYIGFTHIYSKKVAKVTVIGNGMKSASGIAHKMFHVLAQKGINIDAITTSEIRISILIDQNYGELAVRLLHEAYQLDKI